MGLLLAACATSHAAGQSKAPRLTPGDPCIAGAASFHGVNALVLTAILRVEGMRDSQVVGNTNGSVDVGRGGINSVHFKELSKWGIAPAHLLDGCVNTYVAAWLVRRNVARLGNTWAGYAAYHSRTPYYNHRYQILMLNELIRMGVVQGRIQPVPPLVNPG